VLKKTHCARRIFAGIVVTLSTLFLAGCAGFSTSKSQSKVVIPGPSTYSISGTISPASVGSGASVTLSGAAQATTKADSSGNFSFNNLVNGAYTLSVSKSGVHVSPSSQPVTVSGTNVGQIAFSASIPTFSISGTISPAAAGSGATVTISGGVNGSTTADSSGNYTFGNLDAGSYTVSPSKTGATFSPASQAVTVSSANVGQVNFSGTVQIPTYSISGTISPASVGSGATVTLSGAANAVIVSNGSGNFIFGGLSNGSYTVSVAKSGVNMSPSTQQVTVSNANVSQVDFSASLPPTYSISGAISPASVGSGATVTLSGAANASTTSNGAGTYSFSGLSNGSYTVSVSKSGVNMSPSSQQVTVSNANVSQVNFSASLPPTYSISGTISPASVGSGATVTLSGAANAAIVSNGSGNFTFGGLSNGSYTVSVAKSGVNMSPSSQQVTVSNANVSQVNFSASLPPTYSISGTISPASAGSGATVTLSGAANASTTSNGAGTYSFSGLANGSYTVSVSKSGVNMSPSSQQVTVSNANVSQVNFSASLPPTYSISGTISPASVGSGATVTLSGAANASTVSNGAGTYSFSGLANGSYTVSVSKGGVNINPGSQAVTVSNANVTQVNFSATAPTFTISGTISPASAGSGATVTLSGAANAGTTSNGAGTYSFSGLSNGSYTVSVSKSGVNINPGSQAVTVSNANVTQVNFSATAPTFTISGTISPATSGSGATVRLGGAASATTTADASGNYVFNSLSDGSYTVTASKSGVSFTPATQNVTVQGANLNVNFTAASSQLATISGTISPATNGRGATVTLGGAASATTTADASGNFNFVGLSAGSYNVTGSKAGFNFSPASQTVTVSTSNVSGINFIIFSQSASVDILPGQDIPGIVAAARPGTAFIIHPGTYRLTNPISPKNGDMFIGQTACAPPATSCPAVISGSTVIGPLAQFNGTNYVVTGQTQQGNVYQTTAQCIPGWLACNIPEDLFFDGVPLQHLYASSLPTIRSGQWWFDYANHIIYFHDNPSGHLVETSVAPAVAVGPANNVMFQYLTMEEFAAPIGQGGLWPTNGQVMDAQRQANGLNWIVENSELWGHHSAAIAPNFGMQILNNYIHDNGQLGIGGGFGPDNNLVPSGLLVQGNLVTHNNYANVDPNFGAGGIKFGRTFGAVIRSNTITNNEGSGVHFDVSSHSPVIVGNTITGNTDGDGIVYEISWVSAIIYNNLLQFNGIPGVANYNPGYQIHSLTSTGMNAYCNVMEMSPVLSEQGWDVGTSDRGNDRYAPGAHYHSVGNYIHHNTVIWDANAGAYVGYTEAEAANQPTFFADNTPPDFNTYHLGDLSLANFVYDNNNSQSNTRQTFANYQANGADIHGTADTNTASGFPTVAITSPADQSSFNNSVTVAAAASDPSGISKVEFYVDWTLQATATAPPYILNWSSGATGSHTVAAMAYSNAGISSCNAVTLNNQ